MGITVQLVGVKGVKAKGVKLGLIKIKIPCQCKADVSINVIERYLY